MTLNEYVSDGRGAYPKRGEAGVEKDDWLPAGSFAVASGSLCVCCLMLFDSATGVTARVPNGQYTLEGKAMDFIRDVRVSRVRAYLENTRPRLGERLGEVGVDAAMIAVCDATEMTQGPDRGDDQFRDGRLNVDSAADVVNLYVGDHVVTLAACSSGLGDGTYPVFALKDGDRTVGVEVEFLPPDFVME